MSTALQTYDVGDGTVATVIWLDDQNQPVSPSRASYARMTFSDGESAVFVVDRSKNRAAAEWDESQHPRDEAGKFTDSAGSGVEPHEKLAAESKVAIAAGDRLLARAVQGADYGEAGEGEEKWENLPSNIQEKVEQNWINNELENGVDVDTSDIIDDMTNDLRRDNDEIIKETERLVVEGLVFPNENPQLPGLEDKNVRYIDPDTLTVGDDDGDGAHLEDLDEVRFTDGSELTANEREQLVDTWNETYNEKFEEKAQQITESDEYYERRNELEMSELDNRWSNLSDEEKFEAAANTIDLSEVSMRGGGSQLEPGEPSRWLTGIHDEDRGSEEDYQRTRAIAHRMTELRTEEIFAERGIKGVDTEDLINRTWSEWKTSSHSIESNALQLATAQELGGVHRLTAQELSAISSKYSENDMAALRAYSRAQWETTQYVMHRSGQDSTEVYRAIFIPVEGVKREYYDRDGSKISASRDPNVAENYYTKLPEASLLRAGAQSTTSSLHVANSWQGTGNMPAGSQRVVIRMQTPRTSVFSIPVYGQNVQNEREVVVLGTKDKWKWDLWLKYAPEFSHPQLKVAMSLFRALAARAMKKSRKLVVDIQAEDRKLPGHWLAGVNTRLIDSIAKAQKQRGKVRHAARKRPTEGLLHKVADKNAPKFSRVLQQAFDAGRKHLKQHPRDAQGAANAVSKTLKTTLPKLVHSTVVAGGVVSASSLFRTASGFRAAKRERRTVNFAFDVTNQPAVDWADRHAAELVTQISETTREDINNAIAEALEVGDIDDAIEEILAAVGDRRRAEIIANNEVMRAVHEGQRLAWNQAVDEGLLTGTEQRTWIVTGDEKVCAICEGLEDKRASLDEPYTGSDGQEYDGPPAHVSCRCTEGIV